MRTTLLAVLLGLLMTPAHAQAQSWLDGMEMAEVAPRDVRRAKAEAVARVQGDYREPIADEFRDVANAEDTALKPLAGELKKAAKKADRLLKPFVRELGEVLKSHASRATASRPPCSAISEVVGTLLQQQSGTANATGDTRADACEVAQARAASAADQSCDGPFDVDDCRCSQNAGEPVAYSCSARWRCR